MVGDKFRLRFRKAPGLRLLSHHDLMRCLERTCRRADLPLKFTAGFHPSPRVVFALSLPLGIVGADEVVEIELTEPLAADDVRDRLNRHAPPGLSFHAVKVVEPAACAVPRRAVYTLPLPAGRLDEAREAAAALLAADRVWVDRLHPRPRRVNIRPYLRGIHVRDGALVLDLWVTQNGTARADELVRLLGLRDELDAGAVLTRAELEIHDEAPAGATDGPPDGPPELAPLAAAGAGVGAADETGPAATWGASPNGPVVE